MTRRSIPEARYSVATLDWAREEHSRLGDCRPTRVDGERLRARLLSRFLARVLTHLR
ncbi:hypothetical protein [Halomicrococcus sp. NG-SE-24]|uniref:hypothetical protein n=1 Tax=Halomicrococcus sp. NG-SE-24 TaxID=3436928 RepID=UPI003D964D8A